MHRRHNTTNIPIELLRSFIAIQEHGSFTRAASDLNLTQSAISTQMKRLRQIVGGEIFAKDGHGNPLTERGENVDKYARRILAMNDQIMSLAGARQGPNRLRVGIAGVLSSHFLSNVCKVRGDIDIQVCCGPSSDLAKNLASGHLDLAVILSTAPLKARSVFTRDEKLIWLCARTFALNPGAPVPLLSWPGSASDQAAVESLERFGQHYRIAFVASDLGTHIAAMRLGLGVFALPKSVVPPDCRVFKTPCLPQLPTLIAGLYLREGLDEKTALPVTTCFNKALATERILQSAPA